MAEAASSLLTPAEAAEFLRTGVRTIERWRSTGGGPAYLKVGRKVAYRVEDLEAWLARQRREHTGAA
jgi:excisionase family DNA binding protein